MTFILYFFIILSLVFPACGEVSININVDTDTETVSTWFSGSGVSFDGYMVIIPENVNGWLNETAWNLMINSTFEQEPGETLWAYDPGVTAEFAWKST